MIDRDLKTQLGIGVIEPAQSEWAIPVLIVSEKYVTLRFCVYFSSLNAETTPETNKILRIENFIDSLGEATVLSALYILRGHWQVPVHPEDKENNTFTPHLGTYRYTQMPFDLRSAPATFQRALEIILSDVCWRMSAVHLDDVIMVSKGNIALRSPRPRPYTTGERWR